MKELSLKYYTMSDFRLLVDSWLELESGADMTYFQTYAWYEMLWNLNKDIKDSRFEVTFAAVTQEDKVILIAPLWIVKRTFGKFNRKGFYIFGRGGWSDYLNFIYKDFNDNVVTYLLKQLKDKFQLSDFYFENVSESIRLYSYLTSVGNIDSVLSSQICVGLSIDGLQFDQYQKLLSKQSRQNIRTANNRLARDGKSLVYDFCDSNVNLDEFTAYRSVRVAKKNDWGGKTLKWRIINFISTKILGRGWYKFAEYAPYSHDKNSKFMTAKTPDGELCASFNYGVSPDGRSIVLMGVSTNPSYSKYSPGILLLYNFIEKTIETNRYDYIDFTRGNESYKFALGGKEHKIFNIFLNLTTI